MSNAQSPAQAAGPAPEPGPAQPFAPHRRIIADALVGSDPGLNRLFSALAGLISVALGIAAEYAFAKATGALQYPLAKGLPPEALAKIHLANHDVLVIAELLGGLIGVIAAQAVIDVTPRGRLVSLLVLPLPLIGGLAAGLQLAPHHVLLLVALGLALTASIYLLRFGLRGGTAGGMLFLGGVLGDRLAGEISIGHIYWLAAEVGIAVLAAVIVRVVIFRGSAETTVRRTQRTFEARARQALGTVGELLDRPSPRAQAKVHRQLLRLNETALIIDATLPRANVAGSAARTLRESMFDMELALGDLVRFTEEIARLDLPLEQRALAREALVCIHSGQLSRAATVADALVAQLRPTAQQLGRADREATIAVARIAASVHDYIQADKAWRTPMTAAEAQATLEADPFIPAASLVAGWLPGGAPLSAQASIEGRGRRLTKIQLAPYTRAAIQMAVAASLSLFVGNALSSTRFYWAILATWLVFIGTNHTGEQVNKAINRTVGTVVGVFAGGFIAHLIGFHDTLALVVILGAIFVGFYLLRISYAFLIFGITVALAQLYQQLHEFSDHLLLLRLEETAIGAGIAAAVVLAVLPLSNRQVLRVGLLRYVRALQQIVDDAARHLVGDAGGVEIDAQSSSGTTAGMALSRAADAAYYALQLTARPLARRPVGRDGRRARRLRKAIATSHYHARTLSKDVRNAGPVDDELSRGELGRAATTMDGSLSELQGRLDGDRSARYTTSTKVLANLEHGLHRPSGEIDSTLLAVHQLQLIDASMAEVASVLGMAQSELPVSAGHPAKCVSTGRPAQGRAGVTDRAGAAAARAKADPGPPDPRAARHAPERRRRSERAK
jgi:Fusaric acid resistance protein-like